MYTPEDEPDKQDKEELPSTNREEESTRIFNKVKKFLKRSSERFAAEIDMQVRDLEVAGGGFWNQETKERWNLWDREKKQDVIPTVAYNNIGVQANGIASPFSKSPFHCNVVHKDEIGLQLQNKISRTEQSENAKNVYQRAATRSVKCAKGWVVIGTELDQNEQVIPNIEFIANQRSVAPDPDCVEASCEDAEEGAIVSYIGIGKAKRLYGEDVVPHDYPNTQPELDFTQITAWQDQQDRIQIVKYFCKHNEKTMDEKTGQEKDKVTVRMYTLCGNKIIPTDNDELFVEMTCDKIPIVCFSGYTDYDDRYGEVYTSYVRKNWSHIETMSLALTMQAMRMRRSSNVRLLTGKNAMVGCESYFRDFEKVRSLALVWNDTNGAAPPQIVQDTFQTGDIAAVMQEERQSLADCTGVNAAGIVNANKDQTATEILQQQQNSESNVQELYLNWESASHAIAEIMLQIFNGGFAPEFTLEGGPSVITAQMKERAELQAVQQMTPPEMQPLIAIRKAETIDSETGKGLAQDLKANCPLKLTGGQDIGSVMNACEKMKQFCDQLSAQVQELTQQNAQLTQENQSMSMALESQKNAQQMEYIKMQHQFDMDEADMMSQNEQAARKLEMEDNKLQLEARKLEQDRDRQIAEFMRGRK